MRIYCEELKGSREFNIIPSWLPIVDKGWIEIQGYSVKWCYGGNSQKLNLSVAQVACLRAAFKIQSNSVEFKNNMWIRQ